MSSRSAFSAAAERGSHLGFALLEARHEVLLFGDLLVERGLLEVEVLGERAELVDRVVAFLVGAVEELAAAHGVEHVGALHDRVEVRVAALVRLDRSFAGDRGQRGGLLLERRDLLAGPLDLFLEREVLRLCVVVLRGGVVGGAAGLGDACFRFGYGVTGGADRVGRQQRQRQRNGNGEGALPPWAKKVEGHERCRS